MNPQIKPMEQPKPRFNYVDLFRNLKIGEGFEIDENHIASVRVSASTYKRNHPTWNYATRKTANGYDFVRIERN